MSARPRWSVGDPIPAVLTDADLIAVLPYQKSRYYVLKADGAFAFLEVKPQLPGTHTLYCGRKVERWLSGELEQPKFFRSHRTPRRGPGRPPKDAAVPPVLAFRGR